MRSHQAPSVLSSLGVVLLRDRLHDACDRAGGLDARDLQLLRQRFVIFGQRLQRGLDLVDPGNQRSHLFDLPLVLRTDNFLNDEFQHRIRTGKATGTRPRSQKKWGCKFLILQIS